MVVLFTHNLCSIYFPARSTLQIRLECSAKLTEPKGPAWTQQYEHIYRAVHCCLLKWQLHPVWKVSLSFSDLCIRSRLQSGSYRALISRLKHAKRWLKFRHLHATGQCRISLSECIGYGKVYLSLAWDNLHSLADCLCT